MLIACWSAKGGAGTTVVAASLALMLARENPAGAVLADLDGDAPDVLGLTDTNTVGLAGWLRGEGTSAEDLTRLETEAAPGLSLLPRGTGALRADRACSLGSLLERNCRPVVVDCGNLKDRADTDVVTAVATSARRSLLVIRPCYLSLRRATEVALRPTAAIVVTQAGRPISHRQVESTLGVPVIGRVPDDAGIAGAADAGLISRKLPRSLSRGLRGVL